MYTVLACCDAFGNYFPPSVIYQSKHLYKSWCLGGPDGTTYDTSESGWMEGAQFKRWFEKVFISHCQKLEGHKILFLDGHASHITIELIELAKVNNIILLKLPAHTTQMTQMC